MQYLPGFTVQCINAQCDLRGHWLRADATGPIIDDGRCPCCGDMLRNVPPPLGPRFRMRPRALTARPPLRPRPRYVGTFPKPDSRAAPQKNDRSSRVRSFLVRNSTAKLAADQALFGSALPR